jgi:hypothetical protein
VQILPILLQDGLIYGLAEKKRIVNIPMPAYTILYLPEVLYGAHYAHALRFSIPTASSGACKASTAAIKQKEPDMSQISDFEKKIILESIKEMAENFNSITPSAQAVASVALKPENLTPLSVDQKMLSVLGTKLRSAFFLGSIWNSSVDLEFDSFILPHMDVVTKINVSIDEITLDDGTKKIVELEAEERNTNTGKGFTVELPKDVISSNNSADPKISSLTGTAKLTYFENFTKTTVKTQIGTEVNMPDGGTVKVLQSKNDFVQVHFTGKSAFYDVYADDEKGVEIESLKFKEMPILKDGKLLSELSENDILMYVVKENSGQSMKEGLLFNLKFKGIPANIHFISVGKKKDLLQKFTALGKPDSKDISKILGARYINEKKPEAFSFSEKELTEKLTLSLRRNDAILAYLEESPYSNELILDLDNIKKIQYKDRVMEITDVKLLDDKGLEVPIFVNQKDSFGEKNFLIQVPNGENGNINKKDLLKAKKPIFPEGIKLIGKLKLEVPLTYELFSWPGKAYPGVKVDIQGNDIVFGLGSENDFSPSDFFVSDGTEYALFPFGKNHTKWVNNDVEKIERYWGIPTNVILRNPSLKVRYEGQFEFKVPAPILAPATGANPFFDEGPDVVVEQLLISKLKNYSSKLITTNEVVPAVATPEVAITASKSEDTNADEDKMYEQIVALYVKKGLTKELATDTVGKIKDSLKSLTQDQRATSLQGMITALK